EIGVAARTVNAVGDVCVAQEVQHGGATYSRMREIGDITFTWSPVLKPDFQEIRLGQSVDHQHWVPLKLSTLRLVWPCTLDINDNRFMRDLADECGRCRKG